MARPGGALPTTAAAHPGSAVYDADVWVTPESGSLRVSWRGRFAADEASSDSLVLFLNPGLEVTTISGPNVVSVDSSISGNRRRMVLRLSGVAPGSDVPIDMAYGGSPVFSTEGHNYIRSDAVELNFDSGWHPYSIHHQRISGELRVRVPPGWEVASSGTVVEQSAVHVVRSTSPQLDATFVAVPAFQKLPGEGLEVWYREGASGEAAAVLRAATSCAEHHNRRYGGNDPLSGAKLILMGREGPGYNRGTYIVISTVNPEAPVGLHHFVCHELAHYWSRSGDFSSPHHWMSEAFAEYVALTFVRERFGQAEFERMISRFEQVGRGHGPVWTEARSERPNGLAMYRLAPYLLHRLEERIGRDTFDAFLRRYMTERVQTTQELLAHLSAVAGTANAEWFREQLAGSHSAPG